MKAMILAAGLGERMRPLTLTTPKPLLRVGGKPLIHYHLEKLALAGFKSVVINVSWLAGKIKSELGSGARWGLDITYSDETQPLETAGGIRKALNLLTEENPQFAVINGDVWSDMDYSLLGGTSLGEHSARIFLAENPAHHSEGDFSLDDHGMIYLQDATVQRFTFSGISILNRRLFDAADSQENRLGSILRNAARQGTVAGTPMTGRWFDIGTPERLSQLDAILRANSLHSITINTP